jgi:CRP-like cAMP-binding protein
MDKLRKELEKLIVIYDDEWDFVLSKFKPRSAKKGETIHYAGDIFSEVWYIRNGTARSCFINEKGKDLTWQLYFNDDRMNKINLFLSDTVSANEKIPSMLNFEILENADFFVITIKDLNTLFDMNKKWEKLGRILVHDDWYAMTYKRVISIMGETAQERYERLLKDYPDIFKKIKLQYIASYLGIAPQTLSKIRKKEKIKKLKNECR